MDTMSSDAFPTVADEVAAAVRNIDDLIAEARNWRDHILRIPAEADDAPGIVHQAKHSGRIVADLVHQAQDHTRRADQSVTLRSVS